MAVNLTQVAMIETFPSAADYTEVRFTLTTADNVTLEDPDDLAAWRAFLTKLHMAAETQLQHARLAQSGLIAPK
jgi:hypothetical protein